MRPKCRFVRTARLSSSEVRSREDRKDAHDTATVVFEIPSRQRSGRDDKEEIVWPSIGMFTPENHLQMELLSALPTKYRL